MRAPYFYPDSLGIASGFPAGSRSCAARRERRGVSKCLGSTAFSRDDEIEESWRILAPILDAWGKRISINRYRAGSWEVPGVEVLFSGCVGGWHKPT
jgi:hypothetical protein